MLSNLSRAEALLEELAQKGVPRRELLPRWIRLAQAQEDHTTAVTLCHEALADRPRSARLLRGLAISQIALGDLAGAGAALSGFIANSPNRRSGVIVAVDLWREAGYPAEGLALSDSVRLAFAEPRLLARQRAVLLLLLGRYEEGCHELSGELRANPLNLPLVRTDLLDGGFAAADLAPLIPCLTERIAEPSSVPAERLLVVHLLLMQGRADEAVSFAQPLLASRAGSLALLQTVATLAREAPLIGENEPRAAVTDFMLSVLEEMNRQAALAPGLRARVLEILAQVCEDALAAGALAADPATAADRFARMLALVKQGNPHSPHLYSAQIRLAHFTRDVLRQPSVAAERLERLLTDLDLPLEGVALARLTLGECYLAAGDTTRGREVLTRLGRGTRFRAAAGHAHYHLARLDLAEGHWETARDRFAAVAKDDPRANYANDALDLGLAIAEELVNPSGGPGMLALYARSTYFELTAAPDSQRVALKRFIATAAAELDLQLPQYLLERARFELAHLYWAAGESGPALAQCDRIILDHPDGRYPAEALALQGRILAAEEDDVRARQAYERLLTQYPEYLFADDIRDSLRSLP